MIRRDVVVSAAVGVVLGCALGAGIVGREARAAQQVRAWEYRVVTTFIPKPVLEKFNRDRTQIFSHPSLDGPGSEGWELVSALGDADNSEYRQFFFRRPR